jgi:hypothetical protein
MSSERDSWWYLEQDKDGSLHVRYENDDDPSDNWRMPINDFLSRGGSSSHQALVELVDRMFADRKDSGR